MFEEYYGTAAEQAAARAADEAFLAEMQEYGWYPVPVDGEDYMQ